jgi:hypothetical protein
MNQDIIDFDNITYTNLYIEQNNDPIDSQNIDDIINMSWASMVEEELVDSTHDKLLSGSLNKSIKYETFDEITNLEINKLSDIQILEYQMHLSNQLKSNIMTVINDPLNETFDNIKPKLDWLKTTSKYLSDKIGLKSYAHEINQNNKLFSDSSYKFCNYNFKCEFNYSKKYKGCFAQHYVHNVVYADINALINYIDGITNTEIEMLNEIKNSISTLHFVINHMLNELKNAETHFKIPINKIHISYVPKNRKKNK